MHDLRQYQIVQSERNELTFFYVSQNSSIDMDARLKQALKKALAQKGLENCVKLNIKRVDSIARDERSRKFKPIISMQPPGDLDAT